MSRLFLMVVLLGLVPILAADEVHLADGRVLEGEIISAADADPLDIQITSGRVTAVIHVARRDVVSIRRGVSERQQRLDQIEARIKAAALGMDERAADELWSAVRDLISVNQIIRSREVAQMVIDRDRHHAEARELLGFARSKGIWMRPNEIAAAEGRILHEGRWLTWEELQSVEAEAEEARQRREERLAERAEERRQRERNRAVRQAVEDSSRLQPVFSGSNLSSSGYRDSLLYRYYWGCHAPRLQGHVRPVYRGSSLNFHFNGSGWGIGGSIGY